MRIQHSEINCRDIANFHNSNRKKVFRLVECKYNYCSSSEDKREIDKIIEKGMGLKENVNKHAANQSKTIRSDARIICNSIAGILAEHCWKTFLNHFCKIPIVEESQYSDAITQIDLKTTFTNKTIEVRSSFPRNGVPFAICHSRYQFDIIGPYTNYYKIGEIPKDYYLRVLYHLDRPTDFMSECKKDGFVVYLTGGATLDMMKDDKVSFNKSFAPEDGYLDDKASYQVVPFSSALDTIEIAEMINKER